MSLQDANISDISAEQSESLPSIPFDAETQLNESNASNNIGSEQDTETDLPVKNQVIALLAAKIKVAHICKQLNVSQAYVYKIRNNLPKAAKDAEAIKFTEETQLSILQDTIERKHKLIKALYRHHGVVTKALRGAKVEYTEYFEWLQADRGFALQVYETREAAIDYVEGKLFDQIEMGSVKAATFFLETKGKERGYTKRVEHTGKDGEAMDIRVIEPYVDPLADLEDEDNVGDKITETVVEAEVYEPVEKIVEEGLGSSEGDNENGSYAE